MKKTILYLSVFILLLAGCSNDGNNQTVSNGEVGKGDGQGGSLAVFALVGDYLYTVDHNDLNVFSLLNDREPVKVNEVNIGWEIETLFAFGNYLYIGSREGMYIFSLENPETPQLVSNVQHFTACDPVVSNGTHAFVTLHSNTFCGNNLNVLEVYDTSDPNNPVLIHTRNLTHPKGLGLYGNYLFVCDDEIKIFDITNPAAPVLASSINRLCHDVIISGNDLFAIGEHGLYRYELNPDAIENAVFKSEVDFQ